MCSAGGGSLHPPELDALQRRLGYRFRDESLLELALTHRSRAHEDDAPDPGNERLEFLGDAVLDLVVSERLMDLQPDADEGVLSRARAAIVNTQALAARARLLELGDFVLLGRGERRSGGADKPSILANVLEAVLGAVYLDGGIEAAQALIHEEFGHALRAGSDALRDAKTELQERVQKLGRPVPRYTTVGERGPDHAKEFEVEVSVGGDLVARGTGSSKRTAEQEAARDALARLVAAL